MRIQSARIERVGRLHVVRRSQRCASAAQDKIPKRSWFLSDQCAGAGKVRVASFFYEAGGRRGNLKVGMGTCLSPDAVIKKDELMPNKNKKTS